MQNPHLIYQYWNGDMPVAAEYSRELMSAYAERIGAEYRCDLNQNWIGRQHRYYDLLRPVLDRSFYHYRRVLFADMDVYPVAELDENIFDEPMADLAMAEEPDQPWLRQIPVVPHITHEHDQEWSSRFEAEFPRDNQGRLRIFNSGVVLFSSMAKLSEHLWPIARYESSVVGLPQFYRWDQTYMHAMAFVSGIEFAELSPEWNRQVHHLHDGSVYDRRNTETKFVHVQLRGADNMTPSAIDEVVNAPFQS